MITVTATRPVWFRVTKLRQFLRTGQTVRRYGHRYPYRETKPFILWVIGSKQWKGPYM
jgi:hypothetical protein